jgi:hypothetical protein
MEHAFDRLSKNLAQAYSRRQALDIFVRSAVGAFLLSFAGRRAHAQSVECMACGTCQNLDFATGAVTACADPCDAQVLCNQADLLNPFSQLAALLTGDSFQPSTYSALLSTDGSSATTQVFNAAYVSPSGDTANLIVAWYPGGGVLTTALLSDSSGNPTVAYTVNASGTIEANYVPTVPPPFVVSASPASVSVAPGSSGASTVTVSVNVPFSSAIALSAPRLPAGVTATFVPDSFVAPGSGTAVMTLNVDATVPSGVYEITIHGKGSGISETAAMSLLVVGAGAVVGSARWPIEPIAQGRSRAEGGASTELLDSPGLAISLCKVCHFACGQFTGFGASKPCASIAGAVARVCGGPEERILCFVGAYVGCIGGEPTCHYACSRLACTCPPGETVCGIACCPSGQTCSNDQCVCPPGETVCGIACCPSGQTCSNDQCVSAGGCPAGVSQCGMTCCHPGEGCSNGNCSTSQGGCLPGNVVCGDACCPTSGAICCSGSCVPSDYVCCGGASAACPSGSPMCCLPTPFINGGMCCAQDSVCCHDSTGQSVWCCPPTGSCGPTINRCN